MDLNIEPAGDIDLNLEPPPQEGAPPPQEAAPPQHEIDDNGNGFFGMLDLNMEPEQPQDDAIGNMVQDVIIDDNNNVMQGGIDLNFAPPEQAARGRKDVPNEVRNLIFQTCLARSTNGKLKRHVTKDVAQRFRVGIQVVQRIWKKGKSDLAQGIVVDVSNKRRKCGRKEIPIDLSVLRSVPFKDRTTIEDVCAILHISKSKLLRLKRKGVIKRHSNSIKPYLTEANKKTRLQWALDMIDPSSMPDNPMFKGLFDVVYIDEKWFYLTRKSEGYYMKKVPHRTCKSKNNIPKIMFPYKKAAKTIADLVPIVQQEYSTRKANRIFLTLHGVLKEAMKTGGGNKFKIPHMKKGTLERLGRLPVQITCEHTLIAQAMSKLAE
ncbi:hypothetical protein U9M48_037242 [Paspalum notatum var. saurae]|uniref:DUF7769 domain-containing protein n=1 Tax=Paspalum notatum var. saurae TaxID=547442 RepID=A0AAQ3UG06_PASNO